MVMENEIRLGDIMDKLTPSDRVVIYNAARQVVYRGYAANAVHGTLNPQRRIKKMGLGMETYRATEQMWDWEKTDSLLWKSRTLKKQREKARFLHMIFTIMQQGAETRCTAGKFPQSESMKSH